MKINYKILDDSRVEQPLTRDFSTIEISPENDREKEFLIKHQSEIDEILEKYLYRISAQETLVHVEHEINNFIEKIKYEN